MSRHSLPLMPLAYGLLMLNGLLYTWFEGFTGAQLPLLARLFIVGVLPLAPVAHELWRRRAAGEPIQL